MGLDGHHHTLFEMLGTWSFGDYYKSAACKMAVDLLTGPLGLDRDKLFFTYFGGCDSLGLGPDEEAREAWLEVGVASDRVLPFGAGHNFWRMGARGPCGPCAEVHYDHSGRGAGEENEIGFLKSSTVTCLHSLGSF